jgi:hypothetical protein
LNQEVTAWLGRRKLDERAFLLRHLEVVATLSAPDPMDAPDAKDATDSGLAPSSRAHGRRQALA